MVNYENNAYHMPEWESDVPTLCREQVPPVAENKGDHWHLLLVSKWIIKCFLKIACQWLVYQQILWGASWGPYFLFVICCVDADYSMPSPSESLF